MNPPVLRIYCERLDLGFWAEPLNAVSNAAFLLAALLIALRWRKEARGDGLIAFLTLTVAAVGFGSFAFHTLATRAAALADVIPIAIFIHGYLYLALRRYLGLSAALSLVLVAAFLLGSAGWMMLPRPVWLGSSAGYLPALAALLTVAGAAPRVRWPMLGIAALFAFSLSARIADLPLCGAWPHGTHFVWHILNASVLFALLALALHDAKQNPPR